MRLNIRPATTGDSGFVQQLVIEDFREKLAALPQAQQEHLATMQYHGKMTCYAECWPSAEKYMLEQQQRTVGYALLDWSSTKLLVIDLLIAKAVRGQGLGTRFFAWIDAEAANAGVENIELSVAYDNPALRLYQRLNYTIIANSSSHLVLRKAVSKKLTSDIG